MRCAVILAGGSGTRLWPASRRARPKQFLTLGGDATLLAATVARARAVAGRVMVVTAAEQAALVAEAVDDVVVLAEPAARNTAAALGLAAAHAWAADRDAVIGAFPADHHVGDPIAFGAAIERAFAAAERADVIATVGIPPTRPDTGFGYLELGDGEVAPGVRPVARFVEKPDHATAAAYLAGGRHLWNGGMFFVRAARLLDDLDRFVPATGAAMRAIADAIVAGDDASAITAARYPSLPSVSIDVGVMEKTAGVVAVPGRFGWSDVGSWTTVAELAGRDDAGNARVGAAVTIDAADNLIVTDPDTVVAAIGVRGLAIIRAGDAVLVAPIDRAQDVRAAVDALAGAGLGRFL